MFGENNRYLSLAKPPNVGENNRYLTLVKPSNVGENNRYLSLANTQRELPCLKFVIEVSLSSSERFGRYKKYRKNHKKCFFRELLTSAWYYSGEYF